MSIVIDYTKGFFEAAPSGETVGDIAGSATLDLATGNVFSYTPAADTTFVFSNPPTTGTAYGITLKVTGADVTSGYDLANAVYDTVSFSVAGQEASPRGLFFKPDGVVAYIVGASGDEVNQYALSTAWDVSSASFVQNFSVIAQDGNPQGFFFKPDGLKMYIVGSSGAFVYEYDLSTAWDISSASYLQNFSVATEEGVPTGVSFKPDGTKFYITGFIGQDVNEYALSTAWDISTASYTQNFSVASQDTAPEDVFFNPDGTKMFVVGATTDAIFEYDLSTAWDISTASYSSISFSVASQESNPRALFFKSDGSKLYVVGATNDTIYQYSTA